MIERKSARARERERDGQREGGKESARACSCVRVFVSACAADYASLQEAAGMGMHAVELTSTLAPVLPESQQGDQQGEEHPLMRTDRNKRKHKGPSHARRKQLRFGLQQQRLEQANAKATELELRLKDWEEVVVELLQQQRDSETEIMDLRASIEQTFGREGGGLPMVCSLPISTKLSLHGLSVEERVKNGTKTLRGKACEAITTGMGGYYLTWETDVLSASERQGLYVGNDKSKARDAILHHLITTGTTEFDALRPLMLHASGEKGPARFIGRMLQPAQLMLSKFAWKMLSPEEQAMSWLGSLVSRRKNGKVVWEPVWVAYPYLLVDACANWDLNVGHFNSPDKYAKLGAPGSVWYVGVDSVCEVCPDCDKRSLEFRTVKFQFCALCGVHRERVCGEWHRVKKEEE